ncbi:MAG: tRNA (adenosine(37)-N6)-threonylcarbamoyltransferase complex ATPase subunit type 1 TsaE [Candidatus Omnitrophica bacterium]|nr:tRNA (adenosine(37)-N6)-threonylcarbamoyltransferase complex ATPase subunit type 1 TsaE [Candidatus Omnitrophota bacterium]
MAAFLMQPVSWTTNSPVKTQALGRKLAQALQAGDCLALCGDLGSGKTTFVQGVAQGLGVKETVASPTFVIVREYQGKLPVVHIDLYRLNHPADLDGIGYEEYRAGQCVTLIEWAQKIPGVVEDCLEIQFRHQSPAGRKLTGVAHGPRAETLLERWGVS